VRGNGAKPGGCVSIIATLSRSPQARGLASESSRQSSILGW
jgi:hypothetical protein